MKIPTLNLEEPHFHYEDYRIWINFLERRYFSLRALMG